MGGAGLDDWSCWGGLVSLGGLCVGGAGFWLVAGGGCLSLVARPVGGRAECRWVACV